MSKQGDARSPETITSLSSVAKLERTASEFADRHLGRAQIPSGSKVIHDAIWGTQRLYDNEVAILDTPLLQRLRRIHQTGFTYLTYPSVTHTRFDHTLGVLYQIDRLARALLDKYQELDSQTTLVTRENIRRLRVAALLHDCSHGPFSHTSEEFYGTFPEIQEYIRAHKQQFESASASEVLAHLILTSDPFKNFLHELEQHTLLGLEAEWLSKMITGQLKKTENGHYAQMLNGPFDADKLDYIFRDGHYSGLPLGVDLDRLYLKTEIHRITPQNAPKKTLTFTGSMNRLVMARPGINSLEQIVSARMNLTASLYHHHKIRACDCMLKGIFLFCRENGIELCGRKLETAADFLYLTDVEILGDPARSTTNLEVRAMLSNLINRRPLKRALVFSMNSFKRPEYEEGDEAANQEALNLVYKLIDLPFHDHRKLAEEIWLAAGKPGRKEDVWLDFPRRVKSNDLAETFVNVGSLKKPSFLTLGDFIPIEQWSKQYLQQKWRGHVFCRPDDISKISAAAASVLGDRYDIEFTEFAWMLANLDPPPSHAPTTHQRTATPLTRPQRKQSKRRKH